MALLNTMVSKAGGACAGLALLLVALVACSGQSTDPRCLAKRALGDAIRAVDLAEDAERSGDTAAVSSRMNDVARLVRSARTSLGSAGASSGSDGSARRLLEAANYLEFIVRDFGSSGSVDGTLAQFASRELNAAGSTAAGAPLYC